MIALISKLLPNIKEYKDFNKVLDIKLEIEEETEETEETDITIISDKYGTFKWIFNEGHFEIKKVQTDNKVPQITHI